MEKDTIYILHQFNNMDNKLLQLKRQVDTLLDWKKRMEKQQITIFAYGKQSAKILQKNRLVVTGKTKVLSSITFNKAIEVDTNGVILYLPAAIST